MLILRAPNLADEATLRLAYTELAIEGHEGFLLHGFTETTSDFSNYLATVQDFNSVLNIPDGMVQETFLVAEVAGEIVGRISIRHELNEFLFNFGGHIGYMIRPAFRRLGYASEMLKGALIIAKELGIQKVLLTCNDDNLGSIKVIENHGGVLDNTVFDNGKPLRRYWINNA